MWKLFCSLFEDDKKSSVDYLMDKIKAEAISVEIVQVAEQPPTKLREPVQILLDSLEEGWWDFKSYGIYSPHACFIAKHEWFGTELALIDKRDKFTYYNDDHTKPIRHWRLNESWMTSEENETVALAVLRASNRLIEQRALRATELRAGQFFKLLDLKEK